MPEKEALLCTSCLLCIEHVTPQLKRSSASNVDISIWIISIGPIFHNSIRVDGTELSQEAMGCFWQPCNSRAFVGFARATTATAGAICHL